MYDLHHWPTPNAHKISLLLEELGVPYRVVPVDITRGAQHTPEFLALNPNGRMPVLVDHAPADGGAELSVAESGAILRYLADKHGRFGGDGVRQRVQVEQWLMWQMSGLGPMLGQYNHFVRYAPEQVPYGVQRYTQEMLRLLRVLERQLQGHEFLTEAGYSIADMACWPWYAAVREDAVVPRDELRHVEAWHARIQARPATARALAIGNEQHQQPLDDEAKRVLFGTRS